MSRYLTINTAAELICLLIAVFALYKDKNRSWRYFWFFLLITLAIELSSIYLKQHGIKKTTWLYSILTIVEIGFLSNLFRVILSTYIRNFRIFNLGVLILCTLYLVEMISYQSFNARPNLTNTTFDIFIVLASLAYLYYLLTDDNYISLRKDPNFWWVVGAMFFHFGYLSLNILYDFLADSYTKPPPQFAYTFKILNVIFYSIWSYAFICRKWIQKN